MKEREATAAQVKALEARIARADARGAVRAEPNKSSILRLSMELSPEAEKNLTDLFATPDTPDEFAAFKQWVMMTKFSLFAAHSGELHDCKGQFDTREELDAAVAELDPLDRGTCYALQMPEMLVHSYDRQGRYEGVLDVILDEEN